MCTDRYSCDQEQEKLHLQKKISSYSYLWVVLLLLCGWVLFCFVFSFPQSTQYCWLLLRSGRACTAAAVLLLEEVIQAVLPATQHSSPLLYSLNFSDWTYIHTFTPAWTFDNKASERAAKVTRNQLLSAICWSFTYRLYTRTVWKLQVPACNITPSSKRNIGYIGIKNLCKKNYIYDCVSKHYDVLYCCHLQTVFEALGIAKFRRQQVRCTKHLLDSHQRRKKGMQHFLTALCSIYWYISHTASIRRWRLALFLAMLE